MISVSVSMVATNKSRNKGWKGLHFTTTYDEEMSRADLMSGVPYFRLKTFVGTTSVHPWTLISESTLQLLVTAFSMSRYFDCVIRIEVKNKK